MEKYYRNPEIVDGELDGNQVMMHMQQGKYFGLNPVGKRVWDLIEEPQSFEDIVNVLLREFKVDREICEQEVRTFLTNAQKSDVIFSR